MNRRWLALGIGLVMGGCSLLNEPAAPACQGDPALKPCTCLDPRTPGCVAPLNDDNVIPLGAQRKDGGPR